MNNAGMVHATPLRVEGAVGCVSALLGIGTGMVWWGDRNWAWFWAAFGLLALGSVLCWIGYRRAVSVADYVVSLAGLVVSVVGLIVLVVAAVLVAADEDDSDNTTTESRRRYQGRGRRRYARRRRRRCRSRR